MAGKVVEVPNAHPGGQIFQIDEGTSQIQRMIIAREIFSPK